MKIKKGVKVWIEDDTIYTLSQGVQKFLGVSRESISNYVKKGMPHLTRGNTRVYDLKKVMEWKLENESKKIYDNVEKFDADVDEDVEKLNMEQLNRSYKVYAVKKLKHESKIKEIQEKAEMGLYIPADKMDRNMAELSSSFIGILKDIRQILPAKLENMSIAKIETVIDNYFEKLLEKMKKAADNV